MNLQNHQHLTREQKIGFIFLLVFALLTVGLGIIQIRNNIYNPFALRISREDSELLNLAVDEERSRYIDTDHDGLYDFDELNFYQTSPYLPDTDSDGATDKEEIDKGEDPLCAKGTNCNSEIFAISTSTDSITSPLSEDVSTPADILTASQFGSASGDDLNQLIGGPEQLRQMLLGTGKITKEELDKISDETLMQMMQGVFEKQAGGAAEAVGQ